MTEHLDPMFPRTLPGPQGANMCPLLYTLQTKIHEFKSILEDNTDIKMMTTPDDNLETLMVRKSLQFQQNEKPTSYYILSSPLIFIINTKDRNINSK